MSRKERERIAVMRGVKAEELSQVQASELHGYRKFDVDNRGHHQITLLLGPGQWRPNDEQLDPSHGLESWLYSDGLSYDRWSLLVPFLTCLASPGGPIRD